MPRQIREILASVRETGDRGRNTGAPGKYGRSGNPSPGSSDSVLKSPSSVNSSCNEMDWATLERYAWHLSDSRVCEVTSQWFLHFAIELYLKRLTIWPTLLLCCIVCLLHDAERDLILLAKLVSCSSQVAAVFNLNFFKQISYKKFRIPYLFFQPLKLAASNFVHSLGLGSRLPKNF